MTSLRSAADEITKYPAAKQFSHQLLNIAVSTSALFDTRNSDRIFREQGEEAFKAYMREKRDVAFAPGPAFGFVQKMLSLNTSEKPLVNLTILSRSNPQIAQRVHVSLMRHGLHFPDKKDVRQGFGEAYTGGDPITPALLADYGADLFLSAKQHDVQAALQAGYAAGLVMVPPDGCAMPASTGQNIVCAFDFDRVLGVAQGEKQSDFVDSEEFFKKRLQVNPSGALMDYLAHETPHNHLPAQPGPLKNFFVKLFELREQVKQADDSGTKIKIAVVTARSGGVLPRVIRTLEDWGVEPDQLFSVGNVKKSGPLTNLAADIFFDDSARHVEQAPNITAAIWVPWPERDVVPAQQLADNVIALPPRSAPGNRRVAPAPRPDNL